MKRYRTRTNISRFVSHAPLTVTSATDRKCYFAQRLQNFNINFLRPVRCQPAQTIRRSYPDCYPVWVTPETQHTTSNCHLCGTHWWSVQRASEHELSTLRAETNISVRPLRTLFGKRPFVDFNIIESRFLFTWKIIITHKQCKIAWKQHVKKSGLDNVDRTKGLFLNKVSSSLVFQS